MSDTAAKPRPQFRNIGLAQVAFSYRLPLAGKLSILHRISGILLFLCLPLVIVPLFAASVAAPQSFAWIASIAANPIVKLVFLVLILSLIHICRRSPGPASRRSGLLPGPAGRGRRP